MNKPTSGPWQSQHDFDLCGEFTIVGNIDGEIIDGHTHYTYTTVAEVYDNGNLDEDRANARLIAAAPDMLEVLEEIASLHGEINPSNYDHDDACELNRQFVYALTVADAAIRKARGGQS